MEPHRLSSTEPLHSRTPNSHAWLDHGSGEMDHGLDLEAGVDRAGVPLANLSRSSLGRRSESDDEGGGDGEEDGGDEEGDWNERHPCFPHPNPHVPPGSREFESTRIIRVARDYMYSGDLSPAYSNVYPEILEPFVDEDRFRQVVKTVNDGLYIAHSPWAVKNIVDGVVGMLTLWIYEDVVDTEAKKRIADVEEYLQDVNEELAKEGMGARFIPLRRTGYLTVSPPRS